MEFPEVLTYDEGDEAGAARALAAAIRERDIETPLVVASVHGRALGAKLAGPGAHTIPEPGADQQWAADLGSRAHRAGAGAIVAIGGGRCLDVGKLAAARAGLTLVSVPTQLSHDGICSPVAVVPDASGVAESVGAIAPRAVFISIPTLRYSPVASVRAGLGDLLANPLALRDWALAATRGLEDIDERAWELSVESFERIDPYLEEDPERRAGEPRFLAELANALVLSGRAMICAGSSRPASGGEHEISHAIDEVFGGRALHGAQVAFGCVVSCALYGDDHAALRTRLGRLGLPEHPSAMGLSERETVDLLLAAPDTRPGRFTILEDADLDRDGAARLVKEIWGEG